MAVRGAAGLEYKFWIYSAAGRRVLQDYSDASSVLHWTPARAGDYILQVWMRHAGSTAPWESVQTTTGFTVDPSPPPMITAMSMTPAVPTQTGTAVRIQATASGGIDPLQYQFWLLDPVTGWRILQAWGSSNQVAWVLQNVGSHVIQVWVRSAGSTAAYETWQGLGPFTFTAGPLTVTDLTPSYPLPAVPGVPVTWTAHTAGELGRRSSSSSIATAGRRKRGRSCSPTVRRQPGRGRRVRATSALTTCKCGRAGSGHRSPGKPGGGPRCFRWRRRP